MTNIKKIIISAAIVSFLFCSGKAQAKVLPKTAKLVPAETIVLLDIDNFAQMQTQFEKTNFYKLYKDPAMAAFFENVRTKLREKTGKLDGNNILRTFFDAGIWPQERTALALLPNTKTKDINDPEVLLICQWGTNIEKVKDAIAKMLEKNTELGGHKKASENYRGVKIETVVDEKNSEMNYCFIEDSFIASSAAEVLKFVIAHAQAVTGQSLSEDADYNAAYAATGPNHDIDFYVNLKQIIKIFTTKDAEGEDRSMISSLGFDNVTGLNCSVGLARLTQSSYNGKMIVKINGAKKGICKMLDLETSPFRLPRFLPASAYSVMMLNLNVKKAYEELYNMLYSIDPMGAAAISGPIPESGSQGGPDLQVKTDIIDHIGSQILIAECLNKPFSKDAAPKETFLAIAVTNRAAIEKSLASLHGKFIAPDNPQARRELLGHTIYRIEAPAMFMPFGQGGRTPMNGPRRQNAPPPPVFAFAITDSHFIFARETAVEAAIRALRSPGASPIESAKWFTAAKASMPSVLGMARMEDDAAGAELLWWLMKETAKMQMPGSSITTNPQMILARGVFGAFDFTLLPPFETVKKYFNLVGLYGLSRPDGFFIEFNYLNTPAAE